MLQGMSFALVLTDRELLAFHEKNLLFYNQWT